FQRTSPFPTLMTFDAPDSNVCTVRRERSNTPLQALTILNDFVFVEAAQAVAKRILDEMPDEPPCVKLERMMEYTFGRESEPTERRVLLKHFGQLRELAKQNAAESAKLVGTHKPTKASIEEA